MTPHKKNPKTIPNFFPISFLEYEKQIHVKKWIKIKNQKILGGKIINNLYVLFIF